MIKLRFCLVCVLIAVSMLASGAIAQPPPSPKFSPQQLRGDLDVMWHAIREGDPAVDRYRSRAELDAKYARVRRSIVQPMTELEFYAVAAPLVAAVRNGHTQLSLSEPAQTWLSDKAPLLPLGVRVVGDKVRVIADFSPAKIAPGAEILAINNISAGTLIAKSVEGMSLDGMSATPRLQSMGGWQFAYDLIRLHGLRAPYDVRLQTGDSRRRVTLDGRSGQQLVDLSYPFAKSAARKGSYLELAGKTAVMRIAHWDHSVEGKPSPSDEMQSWFKKITDERVETLIIDIRDNGGGSEELATQLFAYLVDKPFKYYDCLSLRAADFRFLKYASNGEEVRRELPNYVKPAEGACRAHGALELTALKNVGIQQPRSPHFGGRVYVLTNAFSFSTSAEFASVFKTAKRGTIVGQETSGGYLGNSSGLEVAVVLPTTRMRLSVPIVDYRLAVPRRRGAPGGVMPDVVTTYTVEDVVEGRDAEFETVRRLEEKLKG